MATTQKGTYYPSDYSKIADVPADMKKMAESIDKQTDNLVQKEEGKGLSSNDFTNELKTKLNNLENYDDTEVKQDIADLDLNKASKAELQEATIALQAELKATRKDLQAGTLEGQDTGESLYLPDSSDARFREFGITGNSKQEKREGYNKFDIQKWLDNNFTVTRGTLNSKNKDKISVTSTETDCFTNTFAMSATANNNIGIVTKLGYEVSGNTAYTIYLDKNNAEANTLYAFFCDEQYNYLSFQHKTFTSDYNVLNFTTPENAKYMSIRLGIGQANKTIEFSNIMLLEGTYTKETIPKYEQYGAMPSLEFPSKVEAVGQDVNIFDKDSAVKGVMFTATGEVQNDKYFSSDYIKVKKNTDYYTNEYAPVVKAFDADKNQIGYLRNVATAGTFNTGNAEYIKARNSVQLETEEQMQNAMDNAKIVEGTEINGYSPYNCGSANVTVCNKNFFDKNKTPDNYYYNSNGTKTIDGTNKFINEELPLHSSYTISYKNKINDNNNVSYVRILELDADNNLIKRTLTSNNNITISVENKTKKVIACVDAGPNAYFEDLMIEANPTATGYIAHEEQTLAMPIQSEMLEGDYLDLDNEEEVHTWGKVELKGTENIALNNNNNKSIFYFDIPGQKVSKEQLKSNTYIYSTVSWQLIKDKQITNEDGNVAIFIREDEVKNIVDFKAKLQELYNAGTPVTIYYKLAEPTKLLFTEVQKTVAKQIREKLHSYKGGTHVYGVDEISPIFNARYTKDLNAVINNLSQQAIEGGN